MTIKKGTCICCSCSLPLTPVCACLCACVCAYISVHERFLCDDLIIPSKLFKHSCKKVHELGCVSFYKYLFYPADFVFLSFFGVTNSDHKGFTFVRISARINNRADKVCL